MPYYTRIYADVKELIGIHSSTGELSETQFNAYKPIAESYLTNLVEINGIDQSTYQSQLNLLGDLVIARRLSNMPGKTTTDRTADRLRITPAEVREYFGDLFDEILVPNGWTTEAFDSLDVESEV